MHLFFDYGALILLALYLLVKYKLIKLDKYLSAIRTLLLIFAAIALTTMAMTWDNHLGHHGFGEMALEMHGKDAGTMGTNMDGMMGMEGMPCHQMPNGAMMGDCDGDKDSEKGTYSQDTTGLPEVIPTEMVELADGDTYDITIEAVSKEINGKQVRMLAYNRQIPGPTLKVAQGAEVTVMLTNEAEVDAMFHSHGLRLINRYDGTALVQQPIAKGETYEYRLTFPDAGAYWYHPHLREEYTQESGLYGNYLVVPEDEEYWSSVDREELLVLDDLLLGGDGDLVSFSKEHGTHALMGRFGNQMLTNGQTDFEFLAQKDEVIRFFVTNVANTRTFNLSFPGAKMKRVGGDASKYEREEFKENVILSPSERVVVEIAYNESGAFEIVSSTPASHQVLGKVIVKDLSSSSYQEVFADLRTNEDVISDIDPFRKHFEREPDKKIRLDIDMKGMMNMDHDMEEESHEEEGDHEEEEEHTLPEEVVGIEWEDDMAMMNNMSTSENVTWRIVDEETKKENMDINWNFSKGDVVKIRIFNDPGTEHPMQHPFHLHGQRFLVVDRDGVRNNNMVWKDTTLVRTGEIVDILVDMSNPGQWMGHCHIAEHLESGMMMSFTVEDAVKPNGA